MKRTLSFLALLALGFGTLAAQETTTVQVAPSDQVIYPDASKILNKTVPATKPTTTPATLPTREPLVTTTPVLAATAKPVSAAVTSHGWFLRWVVSGDEASARAWATTLGRPFRLDALAPSTWEVLVGPFQGEGLSAALSGQVGQVDLVRR